MSILDHLNSFQCFAFDMSHLQVLLILQKKHKSVELIYTTFDSKAYICAFSPRYYMTHTFLGMMAYACNLTTLEYVVGKVLLQKKLRLKSEIFVKKEKGNCCHFKFLILLSLKIICQNDIQCQIFSEIIFLFVSQK